MSRAAAQSAPFARVVVLRSRQPSALGALGERCDKRALVLPAGPYAFPFAAALELARLFHGNALPVNPDAAGLSRAALAQSLRGLALADMQIVAPRLDWLDASSLDLIADLLAFSELAGARLRLLGGLPAPAPESTLAHLPARAQFADEEFDEPKVRILNVNEQALLLTLRAAPQPLTLEALMRACGLRAREFNAALRKLSAAGYADAGPRVGLGAAHEVLPLRDLSRWREAVLEVLDLPDARLAVNAHLGLAGPEAVQLAQLALADHEPALALARFAFVPRRLRNQVSYARALTEFGAVGGARALYDAERGGDLLERARLAAELCKRGSLGRAEAERDLRAAERASRGGPGEVEAATLRAELLHSAGKHAAALKLLRRLPSAQCSKTAPASRAAYFVALARAWRAAGRDDKVVVLIRAAQALALLPASKVRVEACALDCGCGSKARLAEAAARALDVEAARKALPGSPVARAVMRHALGEKPAPGALAPPESFEAMFELFQRHGATLVATIHEGELRVLPAHASARPGLCAWLEAQLAHMAKSPAMLVPLCVSAGEFTGDTLLLFPALGELGPVLALFARPSNPAPLLKLAHPRDVVRRWLKAGLLSPGDLRTLLETSSGEHTPWPTSKPNSRPSNEPSTSR